MAAEKRLTALFFGVLVLSAATVWATVGMGFSPQAPGTWSPSGTLNEARANHTATTLTDGRVLIAGGFGTSGAPLATAEIFAPDTGTYTLLSTTLLVAISGHTATLLPDGTVLFTGGWDNV